MGRKGAGASFYGGSIMQVCTLTVYSVAWLNQEGGVGNSPNFNRKTSTKGGGAARRRR